MKINSLYISAFGGIKDFHLDFSDGFNVIYGKNEGGKSTLMAFIKMMFYGSERSSSSIAKNIRKKYTPWDGSPMAGSIDFEHKGKKYRIEKEFRSSNSTDKTTLVELNLGNRQNVSGDIGTEFFGITLPAFERSVFIGQFGFPESDSAAIGELNSKLSNIAFTGDEAVSFESVFSKLQKARLSLMSKSGKAGIYDKNSHSLKELEQRLEKAEYINQNIKAAKANADKRIKELEAIQNRISDLREKVSFEEDARRAEKLQEYLNLKAELDSLNDNLKLSDGGIIDEMYLRSLKFCISKYSSAKAKAKEKQNQIALIEKSLKSGADLGQATPEAKEKLEKELEALEIYAKKNKEKAVSLETEIESLNSEIRKFTAFKKKGILCLIPGLLLLGLATVLGILNLIVPAAVSGGIGIIFAAMGIVLLSSSSKLTKFLADIETAKQKLMESENDGAENEIFEKRVKLGAIITALNSNTSVIEKQKELLAEAEKELSELLIGLESENNELVKIANRYKPFKDIDTLNADFEEISKICEKQKEIKNSLNFIAKDLGNISYEEAKCRLEELKDRSTDSVTDFDALKKELEGLMGISDSKRNELATLTAEIKATEKTAENPELIKNEISSLSQKCENQKEFCDALDIAMEVLSESYSELRGSFGSVLESKSEEIFSRLTKGKYSNMTVSDSFEIGVTENGVFGNREIGYLSSGTADQAYLSLRLAISSLMSGEEPLPVLLDDALAQYDGDRCKAAIEFLKEYSKNSQIIMFTCHQEIANDSEKSGADCKKL